MISPGFLLNPLCHFLSHMFLNKLLSVCLSFICFSCLLFVFFFGTRSFLRGPVFPQTQYTGRMPLNTRSPWLYLPSAGIRGRCYYAWPNVTVLSWEKEKKSLRSVLPASHFWVCLWVRGIVCLADHGGVFLRKHISVCWLPHSGMSERSWVAG